MMPSSYLHGEQVIFLFLLLLVALFAALAQRVKLPYPIVLVLAGLAISFVPHVPRIPLHPDLVLLILLPPLLYAAAWQTNWREFRANLVSIALLAFGLVAFTVWGVAEFADRFVTALDWKSGFVLGAVVATTDAIAATSIAASIGLPQRIVDILEGESLLNDATGLLALEFGVSMILGGQAPTAGSASLRLLWLVAGGVAIGLLIGLATAWVERWIDDGPVEMVISLIVPYAAYLASEEVRASGVLAVVACGLYLSRRSVEFFSPQTRIQINGAWTSLNFMLNGLVFVLIGMQLPYIMAAIRGYSHRTLLLYGAAFSVLLILLRLVWVYPGAWLAHWVRIKILHQQKPTPSPREVFVVGWTGMRGVVALAAAISLPVTLGSGEPFRQRDLILFLTFSIILVTLVVQGLTLPMLIRALGLAGAAHEDREELDARRDILAEAIGSLERGRRSAANPVEDHIYEDMLHRYRHRLQAIEERLTRHAQPAEPRSEYVDSQQSGRLIALQTSEVERQVLVRLRDEGRIGDDVVRKVERELDLADARLS